jgi:formylglycine-generating enzyme required for sulfatase activity
MHGNVWEWVEDCYKNTYSGAPTDGSAVTFADCKLRVLRGGSWSSVAAEGIRSADRGRNTPTYRDNDVGFRVARTLSPP